MHDSGKRQDFNSGAVRDTAEGKARIDLISPYAQERVGKWVGKGAEKYEERNWEKGIPISRCIASLERHIQQYKRGCTVEDHMAAIATNAQFIMHYEEMIKLGLLPASLDDLPKYEQQISDGTSPGYGDKEDTEPEKFEGFEIQLYDVDWHDDIAWCVVGPDGDLLHKNLKLYFGTHYSEHRGEPLANAPGYYKTKDEARDTIRAYKNKPVWVVDENRLTQYNRIWNWYVVQTRPNNDDGIQYLHSDLKLHKGTLYGGYYPTKEIAEAYLKAYKELK
jgi:hypothetical protein